MNLNIINQKRRNKRLCRIFSVLIILLMFISTTVLTVSADSADLFNLDTYEMDKTQIDMSYFYALGRGGDCYTSWEVTRQRCFYMCKLLVNKLNSALTAYDPGDNVVTMMNVYGFGKDYPEKVDVTHLEELKELIKKWNSLKYQINEVYTDTRSMCGRTAGKGMVNGKEVTLAEYQNLLASIEKKLSELDEFILDLRDNISNDSTNYNSGTVLVESTSVVNFLWSQFSGVIRAFGSSSGAVDNFLGITVTTSGMENVANVVAGVTKTFAYALAVVLFGINITTTALQYEILTLRGGIRVFGRVLLVKFWIDLAIPICVYILNIINSLARQVISTLGAYYTQSQWTQYTEKIDDSWSFGIIGKVIKAIQKIFTLLTDIVYAIPRFILTIIIAVCIILVFIKFIARALELTCLVSLSPLFFATLVGEDSKRYFRRFMSAFLSTAGYIVYVSIVYAVGTSWINGVQASPFPNLLNNLLADIPRAIIIIGCCRAMVKPPKVLLSLADGG